MNLMDGMFGKIAPGLCRVAMDGSVAVKTGGGYRSYDVEHARLTNCDHFALDVGDEFFFVVPTSKAAPGDIILAGGKPKCVVKADDGMLTVINYESATMETMVPERHVFMGNTYLYGKVVSLLGQGGLKGRKGANRMMKNLMLMSMLRGREGQGQSMLLPLMLMGGKADFLDGLFDHDDEEEKEA